MYCLPVHLRGEDWINFIDGDEQGAADNTVSQLQRYFHRPKRPPYLQMLYHEYFEQFVVTKLCPNKFHGCFPDIFPEAGQSALAESERTWVDPMQPAKRHPAPPVLDEAPPGCKHFVRIRVRGEQPVCRLEMKFPRQKEVFYLRLLLLHFPKADFNDCLCHNGTQYASHEETVVASRLLQASDESHAVMRELVDLRYTAAQLRFAFLVLLEQDAKPWTLFKAFAKDLMKDFLDRGIPQDAAHVQLLQILRVSWADAGYDPARWPLQEADHDYCKQEHAPDADDIVQAQTAWQLVKRDKDQVDAAKGLMESLRAKKSAYVFVQDRAGSGKSTLASHLTHQARVEGFTVRNVAATGQAGMQLPDGATAHSVFKIPLSDEDVDLECSLGIRTAETQRLAQTSLVQWDEWPSARRTS